MFGATYSGDDGGKESGNDMEESQMEADDDNGESGAELPLLDSNANFIEDN